MSTGWCRRSAPGELGVAYCARCIAPDGSPEEWPCPRHELGRAQSHITTALSFLRDAEKPYNERAHLAIGALHGYDHPYVLP